jgi:hypothetical protein
MAAPIPPISFIDVAANQANAAMAVTLGGLEVIKSINSNPPTVVGGRTLSTGGRENVRIDTVELRYTGRNSEGKAIPGLRNQDQTNPTIDTVVINQYVDVASNVVVVPIFGSKLKRVLEEIEPNDAEQYQMTVTFDVRGSLLPSTQPIRTEPVSVSFRMLKSKVDCGTTDTRLARVSPGTPLANTECSYYGIDQKFSTSLCCSALGDPSISGCEPLP